MRQFSIVFFLPVLCLGTFVQCGGKKSSEGSAKGSNMASAMGMDTSDAMDGELRVGPDMTAAPPVTTGPTGIRECDDLLDMLSTCHKKHPSLKIAYNAVKRDAAGWKAKAQKKNPKQIGELAKACMRTAKEVRAGFSCK